MQKKYQSKVSLMLVAVLTFLFTGQNNGFALESASKTYSIELYDLIKLFTPDKKLDYNLYDWKTGANNKSVIWLTSGVEMGEHEFYREGEAIVSINGKVLECLENASQPCKWDIVLHGVRNGYLSFDISSVTSQELEQLTIDQLFKNRKFEAKIITYDDFSKTYKVTFPNKKTIEMKIQYSCGSAGCSLTITCKTID
jgi:hypothetical protein